MPVERIYYGANVIQLHLIEEIKKLNAKNVIIVTTRSLLQTDLYKQLHELLISQDLNVLVTLSKQHVKSESLFENIGEIKSHKPDLVISCGGGSAIDTGKVLSLIVSEGITNEEELFSYSLQGSNKSVETVKLIPHLSISTTLSAGDFTSLAGVSCDTNGMKYIFSNVKLTPKICFLDPVYTIETPEQLWLSSGIRAVDHAVETLYSPKKNPINTSLALDALKKLYTYMPLSKEEPSNLDYRLQCQLGAWMSLFSNVNIKMGLSHSIGHQLGSQYNITHGITSAIMLPHVMKFLLPKTFEEQATITDALNAGKPGMSIKEKADLAPMLIKDLIIRLSIPHQLRQFNVQKSSLEKTVENISAEILGDASSYLLNINELKKDVYSLLENAW
ncbi:iron-containing alcohol dehydrogenase [Peribacillus glennii]|uniref:iron-containing alcohol dehydrogenase n=1 Tax=Peribacillus glennii TaxID=2303991 RepID=UPI001313E9AD|nr:iron-containing alcohol dehydrogenase [Peribacillus glennii]